MKLKALLIAFLIPIAMSASVWDTQYKQIENSIKAPQFPDKEFVITKYGASLKVNNAAMLPKTKRLSTKPSMLVQKQAAAR